MIERFLTQTEFTSVEDFRENLRFIVPDNFNFAYDVVDAWAEEKPGKLAMLWTDDTTNAYASRSVTSRSRATAPRPTSLRSAIGRGDVVMLILKRRYEFWLSMLALHKIGAVAVPATHMLTTHDIVYRNNMAGVEGHRLRWRRLRPWRRSKAL